MSAAATESPRARPLSGGLWTLLSWLRRDDSSDSLSSAGSDHSVESFAFLPPAHYRHAAPQSLPSPPPPTASYRKRMHEQDRRRIHDRDLTLHRKYGLYDDIAVSYDVTSLPNRSGTDKQERDRRATSESLQRRTHVPGKRRAPLPPVRAATSATLPYRHSRKRRAPQPPIKEAKAKENITEVQNTDMNPPDRAKNVSPVDVSIECKSEKYVKKEHTTDAKSKQEKNFLKQIFDSKKRRSAIETSAIKILPSISELDKQAAELIESCRLKEKNNNILSTDQKLDTQNSEISKGPRWICITCLRRFDVSVNRCSFCLSSIQKPSHNLKNETKNETIHTQTEKDLRVSPKPKDLEDEEKQQLKKMLKEMKDSLPKKHKPAEPIAAKKNELVTSVSITETPTLRIGSSRPREFISSEEPSSSKKGLENFKNPAYDNTNEIVRKILLRDNVKSKEPLTEKITDVKSTKKLQIDRERTKNEFHSKNKTESVGISETRQLNTPLKISSLLNPVYIPKQRPAQHLKDVPVVSKHDDNERNNEDKNVKSDKIQFQSKTHVVASTSNSPNKDKVENRDRIILTQKQRSPPVLKLGKRTVSTESQTSAANQKPIATKVDEVNQHSRRRDLINQLEKSIAEGDERAAADAAAKLAQLRLSCSVLSFTSQILGQLSNQDNAIQKSAVENKNLIQQSEARGVLNNISSKVTVVPDSAKDPGAISERKQEIRKNETDNRQVDKQEPSCSKSPDKKVNDNKTDASSSQQVTHVDGSDMVTISVWIEDKNAAHGPMKLSIARTARLRDLRAAATARLGVARALQRWIVGRALCADDDAPLAALAGPELDAPFYLCLVESDSKVNSMSTRKDGCTNSAKNSDSGNETKSDNDKAGDVYTELMQLERQAIVPNGDAFECEVCMEDCPAGHGAVLRECVHSFCRNCLSDMIRHCEEPAVPCPAIGCPGTLHEREVRALVSRAEHERWLTLGLAAAESGSRNAFHCRTRDCSGWALCEAGVRTFPCPVCKRNNCVPCQIHNKNPAYDNTNEIVRKILLRDNVKSKEPLTEKITDDSVKSTKKLQIDRERTKNEFHSKNKTESVGISETRQLNTPLKISSLLNPVYIPKQRAVQHLKYVPVVSKHDDNKRKGDDKNVKSDNIQFQNKTHVVASTSSRVENKDRIFVTHKKISPPPVLKLGKRTVSTESQTSAANQKPIATKVDEVNQHSRRRDLINQLEKSIAEGDERAAADAAAKLAQLRLSCSVLSFTSQILGQLSNQDNAIQKSAVENKNLIQQSETEGVLNNISSKVTVVPNSSKDPGVISERKQEIRKNETDNRQVDKQEPSCSKSPDKKVNDNKTDASSSQQVTSVDGSNMVTISVWIEDKNAAHGPIYFSIARTARLRDLRAAATARLGVARALQRWIVGRALCADDDAPLAALAGPELDAPFYLCLVESDSKVNSMSTRNDGCTNSAKNSDSGNETKSDNDKAGDVYTELMQLERQAIVPNGDAFECEVCMEDCPAGHGAVLRECVHSFCRNCLSDMIRHCEEPSVPCPAIGCPGTLHEREIRALVSRAEHERWLTLGLAAAESGSRNAFHCRTRDCSGWALCEAGVRTFPCPVCKRNNCVPCQAIHERETCEQYRSKLQQAANKVTNQTDEGTKALLDSLISRGEALECPECSAFIIKKWGCDWVKCSACKTEICWVTRGRRWGPAGRGDTSAGCRCGVDGNRCHPSCGNCH